MALPYNGKIVCSMLYIYIYENTFLVTEQILVYPLTLPYHDVHYVRGALTAKRRKIAINEK